MIDLKPFKKANLRLLIGEEARRINNYKDCDVIHEALTQVESATNDQETLDAIAYLLVSVQYRGGDTKLIEQYKAEYITEGVERLCVQCNEPLEFSDDLRHGYHYFND